MNAEIHRTRALLVLFAAAVVLLTLIGMNPAWAASRTFVQAAGSPLAVGSTPTTVTNDDFNNDGKMDLAAQNSGSNTVSVRLGNGDGTFQAKPDVGVGSAPTSVTSADLNDDGKSDLAVANYSSNTVSVLRGNGDGTFPTRQDFAVGRGPTSVTSAQLNDDNADGSADSDDFVDLAVANFASDDVSVLLGNGDGTFQPFQPYSIRPPCPPTGTTADCPPPLCFPGGCLRNPIVAGPNQVVAADVNNDGWADLATASLGDTECDAFNPLGCTPIFIPGGVSVRLGNPDGTFQAAKLVKRGSAISSLATEDFNGDGKAEIVATQFDSNLVSVLRGNGDGTFPTEQTFSAGTNPSAVTNADLDGNNVEDLAVSNFGSDNVSVLWGNGSGSFQNAQNFPAGDGPAFVIATRFDADNFADLAIANQNSNNVSVLLNTAPAPETSITKGPPDPDNNASATFEFTSSEPGSTFQCALDDTTAYSTCTSPETVPDQGNLADGSHTFYVKATSGTSNSTDATPATYTWTVDTAGPSIPTINNPQEASLVGGTFVVSGTAEAGSTVELLEGSVSRGTAPANSSGEWSLTLSGVSNGSHAYKARATDEAGNTSAASEVRTVTVDATAPETTILSGPSGYVKNTSASFTFSSPEDGSTFRCSLGSAPFSNCTSPVSYSSLGQGSHTLRVRAIDEVGNADVSPARRDWFVDTVLPRGTMSVNGGNASTSSRSVTLRLSASDPSPASSVASMRFRNRGSTTWGTWSAYATSKSWTLSAGAGTKTVFVQYRDRAGNISATASDTIKFNP